MLSSQRSAPLTLLKAIKKPEKIVYLNNGNRVLSARRALKQALPLFQMIGGTRIAEISQLAPNKFPVYQSTRPNVWAHTRIGQNSGAQGKGGTREQAQISCVMETIENYCQEPRDIHLIRGSYRDLRRNHLICPPRWFLHNAGVAPVRNDEPLMWTKACSLELEEEVLVPAEPVYFPFFSRDYKTRGIYYVGSNGVAAGSSYLEALNHALFEVIERHYIHMHNAGKAKAVALFEDEVRGKFMQDFTRTMGDEFELQLFAIFIPGIKNVPVVKCVLTGEESNYMGHGCCGNVDIAIQRAISEAFQSYAVVSSGGREDIAATRRSHRLIRAKSKAKHPDFRSLSLKDFKRGTLHRKFSNLRQEYRAIRSWLHANGFPHTLACNLSFEAMNVFVVKALVPGLKNPRNVHDKAQLSSRIMQNLKYG